ncbi:hypothetical protein KZX47_05815 [Thermus sp. SYSU G05001]|uniref:UmuC domain-containing protein n=1 Tax=Thermus brevis TaxID=2862456 RepID=A0ABS6ZX85_9DEIN|nr:hypothetical protein [Thermus brevis]MBW6394668.1 hypothetical protein [Thermus brevis]
MVAALLLLPWPIWLLRREDPSLAGFPLAVHRGGRVVALCPWARRLGVREGMGLEVARARVAGLKLLPYPPQAEAAWRGLLSELYRLSPRVEALAPGQALLALAPEEAPTLPKALAEGYGARVGVAAWREVALLAAWASREGQARWVGEGREGEFLDRLPLHVLRGVGLSPEGLERLRLLGLRRVGELRRFRPPQLLAYLREGKALLTYLYGPWRREVARYPLGEGVEVQAVLEPPAEAHEGLFRHLARRLSGRLAPKTAGRLELLVLAEGLAFRGEDWPKRPVREEEEVYLALVRAFQRSGALGLLLEEVRVRAWDLALPATQEGLFRRGGEGLGPLLARFPGALLRAEVVDPGALAPEWGFRFRAWEVRDEALSPSPRGGLREGKTPVGGLPGPAEGGAPAGPLAGRGAVVAP